MSAPEGQSVGADTQGMVIIHRVIRREFGLLPGLIRGATGDVPRAKRVAAHADEMLDFLHTHHTGEDELLWPLLRDRVTMDAGLIDRMEGQHAQVDESVGSMRSDLAQWATTADRGIGERLASTCEVMLDVLREHLAEEESEVLPLVSANLTEAEWGRLAEHGFGAVPPRRRLVMLGHMLEEANPAERAHMMTKVPPPARVAFRLFGHRQHRRETAALRR